MLLQMGPLLHLGPVITLVPSTTPSLLKYQDRLHTTKETIHPKHQTSMRTL